MAKQEGLSPAGDPTTVSDATTGGEASGNGDGGEEGACAESGNDEGGGGDGGQGRPGLAAGKRLKRQSRERRAERYTQRLPLLDEVWAHHLHPRLPTIVTPPLLIIHSFCSPPPLSSFRYYGHNETAGCLEP